MSRLLLLCRGHSGGVGAPTAVSRATSDSAAHAQSPSVPARPRRDLLAGLGLVDVRRLRQRLRGLVLELRHDVGEHDERAEEVLQAGAYTRPPFSST